MPIEIKELHVKINVDSDIKATAPSGGQNDKESIVSACVEQVMQIIANFKER